MITVITKKNDTEYVYTGTQYDVLTTKAISYHTAQGSLLLDVDFSIDYPSSGVEEIPFIRDPKIIYEGDTVEQSLVDQAKVQTRQWKDEEAIENMVITVDGKNYSGSIKMQNEIIFAVQTLSDKPAGEKLTLRTADGSTTSLDLVKIKSIQGVISEKKEIIATAEGHVYADASGNIVIQ